MLTRPALPKRNFLALSVAKDFWNALEDISPDEAYMVAPVKETYPIKHGVMVTPLHDIISRLDNDL